MFQHDVTISIAEFCNKMCHLFESIAVDILAKPFAGGILEQGSIGRGKMNRDKPPKRDKEGCFAAQMENHRFDHYRPMVNFRLREAALNVVVFEKYFVFRTFIPIGKILGGGPWKN